MVFCDLVGGVEIGDSSGNLKNFEIGTSGEIKRFGSARKELMSIWRNVGESANLVGSERVIEAVLIAETEVLTVHCLCYSIFYNI